MKIDYNYNFFNEEANASYKDLEKILVKNYEVYLLLFVHILKQFSPGIVSNSKDQLLFYFLIHLDNFLIH